MTITLPLSKKEKRKRRNSRYYAKHGSKTRGKMFEKCILAMSITRPRWKSVQEYGLTHAKLNSLKNQKLSTVSDIEMRDVEDYFASLMLYVQMLREENS